MPPKIQEEIRNQIIMWNMLYHIMWCELIRFDIEELQNIDEE